MMKATRRLTYIGCVAATFLTLSSSCSLNIQSRHKSAAYSAKELSVKPEQIRLHMRALVEPFVGEIEQSADEIAAGTSSISVKRAAIRWKIEGVPALRSALFQPNPFTAVLDTWVLMYQMADYFETGPGRAELSSDAPRAVNTCLKMEEELNQLASTFPKSHDVKKVRDAARAWATDHPIRYAIRNRETTLSRITQQQVGSNWTAGEILADVASTADDLNREIQIYSDHLFRQARWEVELLKLDLPTTEVMPLAERAVKSSERAAETFDDLAPVIKTAADAAAGAADAATKFTTSAPTLVAAERRAAVEAINSDLRETFTFLQHERIASLEQISLERIAILQQLHEERVAAVGELGDAIAKQREALGRDIEQEGLRIVDHAAWRFFELATIILGLLFVASTVLLFIIRRMFLPPGQRHQAIDERPPRAA